MRIVAVEVGTPSPGMLHLHCSAPGGGRSTVGHLVLTTDHDAEWVASELARRINTTKEWCFGYFEANASGNKIMIILKDEVANCRIYGDPGVDTLKISDWGK